MAHTCICIILHKNPQCCMTGLDCVSGSRCIFVDSGFQSCILEIGLISQIITQSAVLTFPSSHYGSSQLWQFKSSLIQSDSSCCLRQKMDSLQVNVESHKHRIYKDSIAEFSMLTWIWKSHVKGSVGQRFPVNAAHCKKDILVSMIQFQNICLDFSEDLHI